MRIVIDMQGAQASNAQRGIGRYTLSFVQALVRHRGQHEIILALNGQFIDSIEPIRAAFDSILPQQNIRVWQVSTPVSHAERSNDWRRQTAEWIREAFLASLKPDIVLISSLFEGLHDDAVSSIATLNRAIPTAVILYDLIPFIHRKPYLENPVMERWYERKLNHLRRADLLFAISESSRQEALHYLGFAPDTVVNLSAAVDSQFQPHTLTVEHEKMLRERYGLQRPFVLYTGGIDYRKNIEGLIRAYAKLPNALRTDLQLAIVCSVQPNSRIALEVLAQHEGLKAGEFVLTGFVPEDDLIALYNLCKIFVFPSLHEGFGLPALEAMSCGRAVIGSNTSSIAEVIGRDDALFNPYDDQSITEKLTQVLTDSQLCTELQQHSLKQAKQFSWDRCAQRAYAGLERWFSQRQQQSVVLPSRRPKLAYVSPLPPEHSGISDYSAELLPELALYYDIDVIVAQEKITTPWIRANCMQRTVSWFRAHAADYERVMYHFGNSGFHQHMFDLIEEIPGAVVLHDFFLSGVVALDHKYNDWSLALYQSHGYKALQQRCHAANNTEISEIVSRYPCNYHVIQRALGIIVHSENSRQMANQWYGEDVSKHWAVIPHLRVPVMLSNRIDARHQLKISQDAFVVCSFGLVGAAKLNHRLLRSWLLSALRKDKNCILVFVGSNDKGQYGRDLLAMIRKSGLSDRIHITGWADADVFRRYLAAADLAVQLRTDSRGETSGTILDCMNHGIPTVVNRHGSVANLPNDCVWKLPDEFADEALILGLETLWQDAALRQQLSLRAREVILQQHNPRVCAKQYAVALETIYRDRLAHVSILSQALTQIEPKPADELAWIALAAAVSHSIQPQPIRRQLFVDVSELVKQDSKSGIQRVVRCLLQQLIAQPPEGFRVEPVYATLDQSYRYARRFTLGLLNCSKSILVDDFIEYYAGDFFLGLDLQPHVVPAQQSFYRELRHRGVQVKFVVYDLLPLLLPGAFQSGAIQSHQRWLQTVADNDGAICISQSVAAEVEEWFKVNGSDRLRPFKIDWFHLGADLDPAIGSLGVPAQADDLLMRLASRPSFLMVGTLEPRKSHAQVLAGFEKLWSEGYSINLVFVGKKGWMTQSLVKQIQKHPQKDNLLFWLQGTSDEYLEKIYDVSTCLIAASQGEGFGLPLIEAARHKIPIIARDIPVFREVASEHAYYFKGEQPESVVNAVSHWLNLYHDGQHPKSDDIVWLTWFESATELKKLFKREFATC